MYSMVDPALDVCVGVQMRQKSICPGSWNQEELSDGLYSLIFPVVTHTVHFNFDQSLSSTDNLAERDGGN